MTNLVLEERLSLDDYIHNFFVEWSKNNEESIGSDAITNLEEMLAKQLKQYIYARFLSQ